MLETCFLSWQAAYLCGLEFPLLVHRFDVLNSVRLQIHARSRVVSLVMTLLSCPTGYSLESSSRFLAKSIRWYEIEYSAGKKSDSILVVFDKAILLDCPIDLLSVQGFVESAPLDNSL